MTDPLSRPSDARQATSLPNDLNARELARWKARAERAEGLVELQKKLAALLGTPLTTETS